MSQQEANIFDFKSLILKYVAFWPYIFAFTVLSLVVTFFYERYIVYEYLTESNIEIIDKAQDSEMALPTSMTIFNRSMINLDNEIGILSSYDINSRVVSRLESNIKFYDIGRFNKAELSKNQFIDNKFIFEINTDLNEIKYLKKFSISIENDKLNIKEYDENNNLINDYRFNDQSSYSKSHTLPFNLSTQENFKFSETDNKVIDYEIVIYPKRTIVEQFIEKLKFSRSSGIDQSAYGGSDQILISMQHKNRNISEDYINMLIIEFDNDGINDRRLEYKRTIEFVDDRSKILEKELEVIELRKQDFKIENKLTDISSNADFTISKQYDYDSNLFDFQSQKDLLIILKDELNSSSFELLPINFGLTDSKVNELIFAHNQLVSQRENLLNSGAGTNNNIVRSFELRLQDSFDNLMVSIENYEKSLDINISKVEKKEKEFEDFYLEIPEKEKILRSIERQLEVKEALYLLLLQKREEASINFAVVKPTIKLIDSPRSTLYPVYPNKRLIFAAGGLIGILIPLLILSIWFYFDNKVHTRDDLNFIGSPVLAEIPYANDEIFSLNNLNIFSRSALIESFRMLLANLSFIVKKSTGNTILVTSTIKGEGKTLVSTYLSKLLTFRNKKVLLIGTDLRNPQIHSYLGIDKYSSKGLADYLHLDDLKWEDLIIKNENLHIILSGVIPPNPAELLNSKKYTDLIESVKKSYDYIIIDSAPCLLVGDTVQMASLYDTSICVVRANHSTTDVLKFIKDNKDIFNNLCLVLNSVGNSALYGYKYSYQYGYNYGYGYGYSKDS
tara:strand:- start:385 stop:2748 length:2364 start_codon:yes stop_codon:yes gene_type:complete